MSWTFGGIAFDIHDGGDSVFDEWFTPSLEMTIDPSLGGRARVVDVGGMTYEPLAVMAQCDDRGDRDDLVALQTTGEPATLASDDSRSCKAILRAATPVRVKSTTSGVYRAKLVFEYVSES